MHSETLPRITPETALFLDFDGTLVALAAQPELVKVISLHTNPRFAEGPGVAGTFHEDSNLLQAQP